MNENLHEEVSDKYSKIICDNISIEGTKNCRRNNVAPALTNGKRRRSRGAPDICGNATTNVLEVDLEYSAEKKGNDEMTRQRNKECKKDKKPVLSYLEQSAEVPTETNQRDIRMMPNSSPNLREENHLGRKVAPITDRVVITSQMLPKSW